MEKDKFCYKYPRPALSVDCVIFGFNGVELSLLLISRGIEPFRGSWALPGGFVRIEESAEEAAIRELSEETGLIDLYMEQLYTFSAKERDPRGRVVSIAYFALVNLKDYNPQAGDDAAKTRWFTLRDLPSLAFDHEKIVRMAIYRLKGKIKYQPIGFELLSELFTLVELQNLYEAVLETSLDRRNFRRKILNSELLIEHHKVEKTIKGRKAILYQFNKAKYEELSRKGITFEF